MTRLEIDDPRWLEFVVTCPDAIAFHHPAWSALLRDCYQYPAFALALESAPGCIVAGVPAVDVSNRLTGKRWISLPYTDSCRPLIGSSGSLEELTVALDEERRRAVIPSMEVRSTLGESAPRRSHAVTHKLGLAPDLDRVIHTFKRTVRQHIAKGSKAGVVIRRATTAEDVVDKFYSLHLRTRRRQGVPVQPRRFFNLLWERMLQPGLGFCLLAHSENRPVAGAVFLAWNDTIIYKYSASDERYLDLRSNYLILWEAIQWGGSNGYATFDFGRTDLENQGLCHFKRSWGAREEPLIYSTLGEVSGSGTSKRGAKLAERLIRWSPPIVCRVLGELLYKYAA